MAYANLSESHLTDLIEAKLQEYIKAGAPFSAFNIAQALRKDYPSFNIPHNDPYSGAKGCRTIVHEKMAGVMQNNPDWVVGTDPTGMFQMYSTTAASFTPPLQPLATPKKATGIAGMIRKVFNWTPS